MQTSLRLPDDLAAQLETWAKQNHRSRNAEIVALLEQALDEYGPVEPSTPAERLAIAQEHKKVVSRIAQAFGEVEEGGQAGAGVAETKVNAPSEEGAGSNPVPGPQPDSRPTPPSSTSSHKQRKTKCEHRIPPGSYCRVCDQ